MKNNVNSCTYCAKCSLVCPVLDIMKTDPMHIIMQIEEDNYNINDSSVFACINCNKCVEVCPKKIDITDEFLKLKDNILKDNRFIHNKFTLNNELENIWVDNFKRQNFFLKKIMQDLLLKKFFNNIKEYFKRVKSKKYRVIPEKYEEY